MCAANKEKSNPLSSRQDLVAALNTLLAAVDTQFPAGRSRFSLGDTSAHYATDVAQMEGLSRVLWGLFPLIAAGDSTPYSNKYIAAIKQGTDPHSAGYWGEAGPYDQRLVEMAAYGLGLALLQENLTERFSERELMNLHAWLNQITDATMPDSNWNYFAIMVQLGFKRAGLPYDQQAIDRRLYLYVCPRRRLGALWPQPDLPLRDGRLLERSGLLRAGSVHAGHREGDYPPSFALVAAAADYRSRWDPDPRLCLPEPGDVRRL